MKYLFYSYIVQSCRAKFVINFQDSSIERAHIQPEGHTGMQHSFIG